MVFDLEPLISIVINCFNGEKHLPRAIESVLDQSYNNWELVFWDNKSTDNSSKIFKNYNDERMNYYSAPFHTNLSEARNRAVKKTNGKWISFLDCDDYLAKDKLELQVDIINKNIHNLGLIYGITKSVVMESEINTRFGKKFQNNISTNLPNGNIFNRLLINNFIPLSSAMILRSAYFNVGSINNKLTFAEDYDLFLKISKNYNVAFVNQICSYYRVHEKNMSKNHMHVGYVESMYCLKKYFPNPFAIIGYFLNIIKFIILYISKRINHI